MNKIIPFLWFNDNAEDAVNFYINTFNDAKLLTVSRYGEGGPGTAGAFMSASFQLEGQEFIALNGGPYYQITPGISLFVRCPDQAEVDRLWDALAEGGSILQCGWLTDQFGVTWQIIPAILREYLMDENPARAGRVTQAMMKMTKIVIADLQQAYDADQN